MNKCGVGQDNNLVGDDLEQKHYLQKQHVGDKGKMKTRIKEAKEHDRIEDFSTRQRHYSTVC